MNPWTVAHQTPLLMGFSRQKYWSGLPFPSPWNLPDQGIKHGSSELQMDPLPSEPQGTPQYLFFFLIIDLLQSTTDTYLTTTDFAIQFSSVSQWCLTLCNPVDKSYRFGYLMPVSTKPHAAFTSIVTYHYQATHGTPADLLSHTVFAAKKGIACSLL